MPVGQVKTERVAVRTFADRQAHLKDPDLYRALYEVDLTPGRVILAEWTNPYLQFVLKHLDRTDDVIDIGCHKGAVTFRLREWTKGKVAGVDISPNAIIHARAMAQKMEIKNIAFEAAPAEAIPCPDSVFDAAVLTEILEHVFDPAAVLREAERVVRDGGQILLSTPINAAKLEDQDPLREEKTGYALDFHVREYDPAIELADKSGLEYRRFETIHQGDLFGYYLARYEVRK